MRQISGVNTYNGVSCMANYREILKLHSLGLNKTEIASSSQCARNTVAATLQRATNCGLQWPLPEEMSDRQLSERLFPTSPSKPVYKMPDYAYVHKEPQRSGVTLNLLWLEYCDQCRAAGVIPYQSTQFNKYYADYLAKVNATMHLNHKPGEVMQVDWAGDAAAVIDTDTGEIIPAYGIFQLDFAANQFQISNCQYQKENLCSHNHSADASFCIFFASVANCIFVVWPPQCEEKCRCPEGCNPFGSGFPIGARSTLLAHDFAWQSLVCYTFCDR